MKILTGRLRGQRITFEPSLRLRPTANKVRKAIFDMLQGAFEGRRVLDLYSGTGVLGFEALSHGAAAVTFVEKDAARCKKIMENIQRWGLETNAQVCEQDAMIWLYQNSGKKAAYDFVFFDPPYSSDLAAKTLSLISQGALLRKDGFAVLECPNKRSVPEFCGALQAVRRKRYGQTQLLIYRMGGDETRPPGPRLSGALFGGL